ncbi:MAG: hypothetical protein R3Y32_05330 [Bacillota bacterium]
MSKKFILCKLTQKFFSDYPKDQYPEFEEKIGRPYVVFVITIGGNKFGLPLRTNVRHGSCYKFKSTTRNTSSSTGIDFSKAVILNNPLYIGLETTIDNREYIELDGKIIHIMKKFEMYLNKYVNYKNKGVVDKNIEYTYRYSTLQYYHNELGIK